MIHRYKHTTAEKVGFFPEVPTFGTWGSQVQILPLRPFFSRKLGTLPDRNVKWFRGLFPSNLCAYL